MSLSFRLGPRHPLEPSKRKLDYGHALNYIQDELGLIFDATRPNIMGLAIYLGVGAQDVLRLLREMKELGLVRCDMKPKLGPQRWYVVEPEAAGTLASKS